MKPVFEAMWKVPETTPGKQKAFEATTYHSKAVKIQKEIQQNSYHNWR